MARDAFSVVSEKKSVTSDRDPTDAAAHKDPSNVFSEFVISAYRSGLERPIDSLKQIAGLQAQVDQPDEHLAGMMKLSNVVGTATGQILDFLVLNKFASRAAGKLVEAAGEKSLVAGVLADGSVSRAITTSATVGFVNGAILTPLQDNESSFRRLGNGFVDSASFAALGGVGAKYAGKFGDHILGRAGVNAISGVAGGVTNSMLDPISHEAMFPEFKQVAANTTGWALGSVIAGESMSSMSKGLSLTMKQVGRIAGNGNIKVKLEATPTTPLEASLDTTSDRGPRRPPQLDMLSMREIAEKGDIDQLQRNLAVYYPELQKAFPLPGEIESPETYIGYLTDPEFPWEMEQLKGKDGAVNGGLQYQILDVGGEQISKAGWLEHIWVKDGARSEGLGSALLDHVQAQIQAKGGALTMWEFNDPDKMTSEEIEEDAKGGITTQDRVSYWANRGAYVLAVPSTGALADYAQPGMEGQEPVPYLSTAWNAPGGLDGKTMPIDDYKKTLLAAHSTIVDVDKDPTVKEYIDSLDSLPDTHLNFVRLSDYLAERAIQLDIDHHQGIADAQTRRDRWTGATPLQPEE